MANLDITIPQPSVNAGVPFAGQVGISGARPLAIVRISVKQVQGTNLWSGGGTTQVDAQGNGTLPLHIALAGNPPGREIATLLAEASDEVGDYFWAAAKSTEVI